MRHVVVKSRADGVIELAPRLAPLDPGDRLIVIVTVLLLTAGLFMCGVLPPAVAGVMVASCVAGDFFLALKAVALVLLRPAAKVVRVWDFDPRRRR